MLKIYSQNHTEEEAKVFVKKHYENVLNDKQGRYYDNLALIQGKKLNILDFGCGWGFYSIELSKKGHSIKAIDYPNEIAICKVAWGEINNVQFSTQKINELPENYFDYVLSSQVIEHVHNPGTYLHEINRVLKPNGRLVISTPNTINPRFIIPMFSPNFFKNIMEKNHKTLYNYEKSQDHIQAWDPLHFAKLLGSCGFEIEKYIAGEGIPFPMRKPFPSYIRNWISRISIFRSFSYTMNFRCKKIKYIKIDKND